MWQRILCVVLFFYSFDILADNTVLKLFRPYGDTSDQIIPQIINTLSGDCFSQSQLIIREDAWRCDAGGKTYDPCFVKAGPNRMEALCLQSPWNNESIKITLKQSLDNQHNEILDMSHTYPWAIELVNGERCQAIESGAVYDQMPVRYKCTNNDFLFGHLQRCKPLWSMLQKTAQGVVTREVKKAWF